MPRVAPVPVHVVVPFAGTVCVVGKQPGINRVSPGVPPVHVTITISAGSAGLGFAMHTGITGAVNMTIAGDPPILRVASCAVTA